MMKVLAFLLVAAYVALLCLIVYHAVIAVAHYVMDRRKADEPWEPREVHRNKMTAIELHKPGCDPMQIGEAVPHHLPFAEYESKVEDLWAEAQVVAEGKNRRLTSGS